jgi:hypothetical protein
MSYPPLRIAVPDALTFTKTVFGDILVLSGQSGLRQQIFFHLPLIFY